MTAKNSENDKKPTFGFWYANTQYEVKSKFTESQVFIQKGTT